ncbi:MAG: tetratricopeptide repeat protein [Acidiferrobacteraceae bacterium]|jgi:tetratricopeptide (TPR) repeat protein
MTRLRTGVVAALAMGLLVSLVMPSLARAAGESEFSHGIKAFRHGDYRLAAAWFESAQAEGMTGAPLLYNLGVSYFKLAKLEKSRKYFRLLTSNPSMAPLARYNLAIIADHQGRRDDAIALLRLVLEHSSDEKLLYIARRKLDELRAHTGVWRGFVSAGVGYNDNVTIAPTGTAAGPDTFLAAGVHLENLIRGVWNDGWFVAGNFFTRKYLTLDLYNQDLLQLELRRLTTWGDTGVWYGAFADTSEFGNSPYQSHLGIQAAFRRSLGDRNVLRARIRAETIQSLAASYDYLAGTRQQMRLIWQSGTRKHNIQIRYYFEQNDRRDQPTASFSPTAQILDARVSRNLGSRWLGTLGLSYGESDFPPRGAQNRHDKRSGARLEFSRRLNKDAKVRIRLLATSNLSTDPAYQFSSNQADASFLVYF